MSEQIPPPEFDSQHYARPNEGWICGHAAEGQACPLGPDRKGRCQASAECAPSLETLPGESKGRWRCNRSGEKCEHGPLPDGSCGRPIPKCAPVPTLRTLRGRISRFVVAFSCAALLILLGSPRARQPFINPGPLSAAHAPEPAGSAPGTNRLACGACHTAGSAGPNGILTAALQAEPFPWRISELLGAKTGDPSRMDAKCQNCHAGHAFHQVNAPREVGCSFCHREHEGAGRLPATTDAHCGLCHADATLMAAAAAKGERLIAKESTVGRPVGGFTDIIHSFATDHPEFRAVRSQNRDPDTLKFNHQLHLNGPTIPALANGSKLDCAFCHQPDAPGILMRPVRFENHCQGCHSLQFDPETPDLTLPHGNAQFVSAFLHSLPEQYASLARRKGITDAGERKRFAEAKLAGLRAQVQPGEDFERRVFFSNALAGPEARTGAVEGATRALYPGCAYCHEVKAGVSRIAEITRPVLVERWLTHADFEHGKHASIACSQCHAAQQSRETSDVLLPAKASCVGCHSPAGRAPASCVTCHRYHHPEGAKESKLTLKTSPPD
jgi:hypothetical protein